MKNKKIVTTGILFLGIFLFWGCETQDAKDLSAAAVKRANTCVDSEAWPGNLYMYGSTSGLYQDGSTFILKDTCIKTTLKGKKKTQAEGPTGDLIKEYFCKYDTSTQTMTPSFEILSCTCTNGVCSGAPSCTKTDGSSGSDNLKIDEMGIARGMDPNGKSFEESDECTRNGNPALEGESVTEIACERTTKGDGFTFAGKIKYTQSCAEKNPKYVCRMGKCCDPSDTRNCVVKEKEENASLDTGTGSIKKMPRILRGRD